MDWTKNYSAAELKKQQQNFIREALEMAKKSVRSEPEPPPQKAVQIVEKAEAAAPVIAAPIVNEETPKTEEIAVSTEQPLSVEKAEQKTVTEEELTKYSPEPVEKEDEYIESEKAATKEEKSEIIELKSNLERLIEQITEERRHDDAKKPQCNCPACQKKRMGK